MENLCKVLGVLYLFQVIIAFICTVISVYQRNKFDKENYFSRLVLKRKVLTILFLILAIPFIPIWATIEFGEDMIV